jgi:hypothetical protein
MLHLTPAQEPRISLASVVRHLLRAARQLLIDALRLGASLALLYLTAVALGLLR